MQNEPFLEINEPFLEITEARARIKSRFFFEIFKYLKYLNRERRAFFGKPASLSKKDKIFRASRRRKICLN